MSIDRLCSLCHDLFSGTARAAERGGRHPKTIKFAHHPGHASLREALDLPCYICTFAWHEVDISTDVREIVTSAIEVFIHKGEHDAYELGFRSGPRWLPAKRIALAHYDGPSINIIRG